MVTSVLPCGSPRLLSPPAVPVTSLLVKVMSEWLPPPDPPLRTTSCRGTLGRVNWSPKPSPAGFGPTKVWPEKMLPSTVMPVTVPPNSDSIPASPAARMSLPRKV